MEPNSSIEEELLKREICSSPYVKSKEPSNEEIQFAIDELNERKSVVDESIESEYEGAINIDNILISRNFKENECNTKNIHNEVDNIRAECISDQGFKLFENDLSEASDFNNNRNSNEITRKKSNMSVENKMITNSKKISDLEVINSDNYLKPYEKKIKDRLNKFRTLLKEIEKNEGSLKEFSESYKRMGLNMTENGIEYREYAPGAKDITIVS
jgi:hypothetical protein